MELVQRGKVRDMYRDGDDLIMVASDRVSVYDVVLPTEIPDKGRVLTALSLWWFIQLEHAGVSTHVIWGGGVPAQWAGRAIRCRPLDMIPVECVVRGYLAGSAWTEYEQFGTVNGLRLPPGLLEGSKLPVPVFTPATKAAVGEHDQPLTRAQMAGLVGDNTTTVLENLSLLIYRLASRVAQVQGLLIADTKFEFGSLPDGSIVLADEVLTPDSTRFWDVNEWLPGRGQRALDKQIVRDWVDFASWDRQPPGPELPAYVVTNVRNCYVGVYERLTGWAFAG
jgi:phosphoribosylaminoimidazole-succinocarboxamide synthase